MVEPYGDHPLRFLVQSSERSEIKHLVDLGGNFPLGRCACEHFSIRIQPQVDEAKRTRGKALSSWRCKHILAAREFLLATVIQQLMKANG